MVTVEQLQEITKRFKGNKTIIRRGNATMISMSAGCGWHRTIFKDEFDNKTTQTMLERIKIFIWQSQHE